MKAGWLRVASVLALLVLSGIVASLLHLGQLIVYAMLAIFGVAIGGWLIKAARAGKSLRDGKA